MGLREQLLKAGLVNKKQAKRAEAEARKQEHDVRAGTQAGKEAEAVRDTEREALDREAAAKREADRARNLALEAERRDKEKAHRARQLLRSNRLNEYKPTLTYHFVEGGRHVRKVAVNAYQREMLARGKMAIARPTPEADDFWLVPAHTADTLVALAPELVVARHAPLDDSQELPVE